MAIVFLAPTEKYCAAMAPDSMSHTEPYHPKFKEKSRLVLTKKYYQVSVAQW